MAHFEELPDSVHVDFTGQFDASSVSLSSLPIGQPYPAVYSESGTLHLPRDRTHGTRIDSGRSVRRFFGIAKSGPLAVPVEAAFAETRRSSSQYGSLHQRPQRKPSQFGVPAAERFVDHVTEQWDPKSFTTITTKVVAAPFQWYRKPHLRQEWLDAERHVLRREKAERKAGFMELFYDLIFVAVIAQFGHEIRFQYSFHYTFFLEFLSLLNIWFLTTFYVNRFDAEDGVHKLFALFIMAGIVGMGIASNIFTVSLGYQSRVHQAYLVSYLFSRVMIEVMHVAALVVPSARPYIFYHLSLAALTVSLWVVAIGVSDEVARVVLVSMSLFADFFGPLVSQWFPRRWRVAVPLNLEHVIERFGLFSIIILGETIIATLFQEVGAFRAEQWGAAALGLLLSFSIQWVYFDVENGSHGLKMHRHALRRGGFKAMLWLYSHIPVDISLVLCAGGVWNVVHYYSGVREVALQQTCNSTGLRAAQLIGDPLSDPCNADPFYYARWLLCSGAAATLLFVSVNGLSHKRADTGLFRLWQRSLLRAMCAVTLFLLPLAGRALEPLSYLGIVVALWGLVVVVALEHTPRRPTGDAAESAPKDEWSPPVRVMSKHSLGGSMRSPRGAAGQPIVDSDDAALQWQPPVRVVSKATLGVHELHSHHEADVEHWHAPSRSHSRAQLDVVPGVATVTSGTAEDVPRAEAFLQALCESGALDLHDVREVQIEGTIPLLDNEQLAPEAAWHQVGEHRIDEEMGGAAQVAVDVEEAGSAMVAAEPQLDKEFV